MEMCIDRRGRRGTAPSAARLLAAWCAVAALGAAVAAGCGGDRATSRVVSGTVSIGGSPVESGQVRFVPIKGTSGPTSVGQIAAGKYRIEARGGVPVGTHRVEIVEYGKGDWEGSGFEPGTRPRAPAAPSAARPYAGAKSPLEVEVKATGGARFDFDLPAP